MKIGFIGLGNMAGAMIGGILNKKLAEPADILGSAKTETTCKKMQETWGITACTDNKKVAALADILVLAVKPVFFPEVLEEIREVIRPETMVISIAAGKTIAFIEEGLKLPAGKIVRCMPNTPALVGEGCTGICANKNVTPEELFLVLNLMRAFGVAEIVPEKLMDVVVGVSGSSPAYVFMFIEAMADQAVAAGMPRKQAYQFAAQAVLGSAKMVLETGRHPGELKDMVCSPGGTTIQAVKVLEEKGMRAAVMDAMEACIEKSKQL